MSTAMHWLRLPSGGYVNLARIARVYREHTGVVYACYGHEEIPDSFTGEDAEHLLKALEWQHYRLPAFSPPAEEAAP